MKKIHGKLWFYQKKLRKVLLIMKLSILLLVIGQMVAFANAKAQTKIDIRRQTMTYEELFQEIQKQTGMTVMYSNDQLDRTRQVEVAARGKELKEVLTETLEGTGLRFEFRDEFIVLQRMPQAEPQQQAKDLVQVKGKVTDEKGNPMPGVTVVIYGTTIGVATDENGQYVIQTKADGVLRFSFVGYETQTVPLDGKKTINVRLKSASADLEEVVVTAFGEQKEKSLVGSIASVRPMDLKSSNSDLTASFVGKIAGIIGFQTGGRPGALTEEEMNTEFYIRGVTSFAGTSTPLILLDGVETSRLDLARMAPEDIETFSVLKDASATAMYGARGANGVILVTTKKGMEGAVYTTVRYESVLSEPTQDIDIVGPIDYMRYYNRAILGRSATATPRYSVDRINRTASGKYPNWVYPANDWYDILFKKRSVNHRAGLTIRGGSKVMQYYASVNYNYDQGMLKADRLNQFDPNIRNHQIGYRINLNIDLNAGIKLNINSSATVDRNHGPLADTRMVYAHVFNTSPVEFAPTYPGDENYNWPHIRFGIGPTGTKNGVNPYAEVQKGYVERTRYSTINRAEYIQNLSSLVKGLELRLSASYVQSGLFNQGFKVEPYLYYMNPDDYNPVTGKFSLTPDPYTNNRRSSTTLGVDGYSGGANSETRMTYEGRLYHNAAWGNHQTSLAAVFQAYELTFSPISEVLNGMPQRNLNYSFRASYGYKDRYFIEANGAYNGSERFAKGNRMGFFPSVGAAWVASDEPWMKSLSRVLPYLKVRISYGKVGNDGIVDKPRFVYLPQLGDISSSDLAGTIASQQTRMDLVPGKTNEFARKAVITYMNPSIQWEIAETANLGLETKFFNGIVELQADVYQEIRHNIISNREIIPAGMGIEVAPLSNIGATRSRGVDITGKIQHAFSKDLWFILNGTFTYNKVTYREIEEAVDKPLWQRKVGKEIHQAMGYVAEGLFRDQAEIDNAPRQDGDVMPGDIRYRDLNGDNKIDVNDATFIGYPEKPRMVYGFSGFLKYKLLELNFSFQGSGKRTFFMNPMALSPFVNDRAMLKAIADDHWSEDNMAKRPFWPRLSSYAIDQHNPYEDWYNEENAETRKSTYFMHECRFLRCTAISLACNMPDKWLKKLRLQNAKLTFTTNNPFSITNFKIWDVELGENGFNYPIQRTYSVGLNVSF